MVTASKTGKKTTSKLKKAVSKRATPRTNADTPWKNILKNYLKDFFELCFPMAFEEIDWQIKPIFKDKELNQITPQSMSGDKVVDKLVEVTLKSGIKKPILIHIEVQGSKGPPHYLIENRMLIYFCRIYGEWMLPVSSFLVLTDSNPNWRPDYIEHAHLGSKMHLAFNLFKVIDYSSPEKRAYLEQSNNPFSTVILVVLDYILYKGMDEDFIYQLKTNLSIKLYEKGYKKQDIWNLYTFIDWIFRLPDYLEVKYKDEIIKFEEKLGVEYIAPSLQVARQQGKHEGKQEGKREGKQEGKHETLQDVLTILLKAKFNQVPATYKRKIQIADDDQLSDWLKQLLEAKKLEEVFASTN